MKTILSLLCLIGSLGLWSQEDSLYISIFVEPIEELVIEEADSLEVVDDPLLIDMSIHTYDYTFYVSGIDTIATHEIDLTFSDGGDISYSETLLLSDIDSDDEMLREDDSIYILVGTFDFIPTYTFTATTKDSQGNILLISSDVYIEED